MILSRKKSQFKGLIPVGWFHGDLVWDSFRQILWVVNIKGLPQSSRLDEKTGLVGFYSHQNIGTISIFELPHSKELKELSRQVLVNFYETRIGESL